jgi:DNA processing protein
LDTTRLKEFIRIRLLLDTEGVGIITILKLVDVFGTIDNIFSADNHQFIKLAKLNSDVANRLSHSIKNIQGFEESISKEIDTIISKNINVTTFWNDDYPTQLKNIYYPPLILYSVGKFLPNDNQSVAIVGTRKSTDYGKLNTQYFSSELAKKNITIVSGLARGIDSIAHKAALKANGRTIAIIGSGLDVVYPPENKSLFTQIVQNGVVFSEFPLGTKPDAQNFPKRNRIIAGISLGTLVIETKENGGAMQTAKFAFDQNKEVFAIPGNLTSEQSNGTNILIQRNSAKLVREPEDLIVELNLKLNPIIERSISTTKFELSLFEEKIYETLDVLPKQIDTISREANLSISDSLVNLLSLEFKGLIQQLPGKQFKKI